MLTAITERRANYRARLGTSDRATVTLETQSGEILQGHLWDISASGLCARFAPPVAALAQGELLACCTIRFGPGDEVTSALEVRFISAETHPDQWRVGGRFIKMERAQQNRVERFVAALDREMRNKGIPLK